MAYLAADASQTLTGMADIAVAAGQLAKSLLPMARAPMRHKAPRDFQTEADLQVEKQIVGALRSAFPDHGISGEEQVGNVDLGSGAPRFLIDPIDGTTNFAWGLPHFGIVISLEKAGEIVAGVVYDPMQDELFSAQKGTGAFLNGRPIQASMEADPVNTVIGAGLPIPGQVVSVDEETYHRAVRRLMATTSGVRRLGSAALSIAYVACGRLDGFFEDGLSALDYGASALALREAGGVVTAFDGGPIAAKGPILAAGTNMHGWLLDGFAA